ncbi:hypothetical protein BpHYR1_026065 [Brachionus plicatilis]|uniref:Uncharacterized protein n=1 Tax=Brachionus plicatilis TaxID=10195 RepID=A0A3M7QQ06_BRAPC|nr:hypothetical protein BpHYR1_026065 [Brachionus plicatilis]
MIKLAQVLILFLIVEFINCQKIKFCSPVTSNINPDELPKLPDEFEARVELNSINENLNSEVKILYDRNEKRADVTIRDQNNTFRQIYDFEHDQLFTLIMVI